MKSSKFLLLLFLVSLCHAQNSRVIIDKNGVMRWKETRQEIQGFGVNYTVPFAHAYRSAEKLGVDQKEAIENDVYHFSRLGFDLFRVHVWDTEISDTLGNLLENEHLDHFDFLLKTLKDRDINIVLTPIAYWGNGWPEPDEPTPGFSHKYGKGNCLTDPEAIAAQENYLYQFMNHVNPYTGMAYKDDPDILAVEISNEPHHGGTAEEVTTFVRKMVRAVKRSGTRKPVFYNISHSIRFAEAYFRGGIDGGTFQWYPTGLGYQRELPGNHLPNVADYNIPFDPVIKKYKGAKLVYEFDAADVGKAWMYPAMARSFRSAGIQIATHFSYDPSFLGPFNTEYNTHYMNLNYTPQKALALKIASEVFRQVALNADHGPYPDHNTFGPFTLDPEMDLALLNDGEKYFHTNTTAIQPMNEDNLKAIAGYGSSPVVSYPGKGAYFLDRLEQGLWRLEVMPDAVEINNPYGRNSLTKQVGALLWKSYPMQVDIADLGTNFQVLAINKGNSFKTTVSGKEFDIKPGTYILKNNEISADHRSHKTHGNFPLNAYFAPKSNLKKPVLIHQPSKSATEGHPQDLVINYYSPKDLASVSVLLLSGRRAETIILDNSDSYTYTGTISGEFVQRGYLNYYIIVKDQDGKSTTYPAGAAGRPFDWDFHQRQPYRVMVVTEDTPISLFSANTDHDKLVRPWRPGLGLKPIVGTNESAYYIDLEHIKVRDPAYADKTLLYDYSIKHFVNEAISDRKQDLPHMNQLSVKGKSLNDKPCTIQVALVMDNGLAYGGQMVLQPEYGSYSLDLSDLVRVNTVLLPRPYPTFLPYFLEHGMDEAFDINRVSSLQLSIGPGLTPAKQREKHGIAITEIELNR